MFTANFFAHTLLYFLRMNSEQWYPWVKITDLFKALIHGTRFSPEVVAHFQFHPCFTNLPILPRSPVSVYYYILLHIYCYICKLHLSLAFQDGLLICMSMMCQCNKFPFCIFSFYINLNYPFIYKEHRHSGPSRGLQIFSRLFTHTAVWKLFSHRKMSLVI